MHAAADQKAMESDETKMKQQHEIINNKIMTRSKEDQDKITMGS